MSTLSIALPKLPPQDDDLRPTAPRTPLVASGTRARVTLTEREQRVVAAIQGGLPLSARPYAEIGERIGLSEGEVIEHIADLQQRGIIKRLGVVVRHHELGYRANAMVVWDVPYDQVATLGRCLGGFDFVTLCYRRARRLPDWRYNLFCMIHGRDRKTVLEHVEFLVRTCGLEGIPRQVLFSGRRFKQRGALYRGILNSQC